MFVLARGRGRGVAVPHSVTNGLSFVRNISLGLLLTHELKECQHLRTRDSKKVMETLKDSRIDRVDSGPETFDTALTEKELATGYTGE